MAEEVVVERVPNCNFCQQKGKITPAKYDAKTRFGAWANMCQEDFDAYGLGRLGTGLGQRLIPARADS